MLYRCGEQFRRVFIEGDIEPPGFDAVVGRSAHEVAKDNLTRKIESGGTLMAIDEVKDLARDSFVKVWTSTPVILSREERDGGLDRIKAKGIDRTIGLSVAHATQLAPKMNPKPGGIERKWVVEAKGYPYDLAGQFDLEEKDDTIRDFKTGGKLVTQRIADTTEQLTIYAWAKWIIDKVLPPKVVLDGAAMTDAGTIRVESFESTRTREDFDVARRRFDRAVEVIEKGAFTPANPTDWWCSQKFCGFAADGSCPFFNRQRALQVRVTDKPKGVSNGRSKQSAVVKAGSPDWWAATR